LLVIFFLNRCSLLHLHSKVYLSSRLKMAAWEVSSMTTLKVSFPKL
jgi:hypothetical protein